MPLDKELGTGLQHWNNNMLCAIDIETTGLDPEQHEIWQIAIVPLNANIEPRDNLLPLTMLIKPEKMETCDKYDTFIKGQYNKILDACVRGFDKEAAVDVLLEWIDSLNLPYSKFGGHRKRIIPLGHNYAAFDRQFIIKWLGKDLYEEQFHHKVRDTMLFADMVNDVYGFRSDRVPYSKSNLRWLTTLLNVQNFNAHDALNDAVAAAGCYKQMLMKAIL